MRIFNNESMWDAENQQWYDTYSINGKIVDEEIYHEQLEVEMLVADDEMELEDESYLCKCCSCDNDDCDEYNCTCNKPDCCEDNEIENEKNYIDNDLVIQCDCPDCVAMREKIKSDECDCDCLECRENRKVIFLAEAVKMIFESDMCPQCVYELLENVYDEGYSQGYDDAREEMRDYLED